MLDQLKISYENLEASSYITVAFPPEAGLIHYQLEMIVSNDISHFLAVSKRMVDGETIAYYNISSKMTLGQVLSRRKLRRQELICLITGILEAMKEAQEYQLTSSGLIMDPEYIYVDPDTCNPSFLYLPVMESENKGLRELMLDLIMQGKIEMSNDNFIQVLLENVNRQPFSMEQMEEMLRQFKPVSGNREVQKPQVNFRNQGNPVPQVRPVTQQQPIQQSEPLPQPERMPERKPAAPKPPTAGAGEAKPAVPKQTKKKKDQIKPAEEVPEEEPVFDAEAAKKKFVIPQALVMVAVAALVSFGAFTDESGAVAISNILGVVIVIAVFEIILYREIYVNSKAKTGGKSKKVSKTKKTKDSSNFEKDRPVVPRSVAPQPPASRPQPLQPQPPQSQVPREQPRLQAVQQPAMEYMQKQKMDGMGLYHQPSEIRAGVMGSRAEETELNSETELWDGSQNGMEAYLEYYVNGMMTRIPLDKPSFLIGRLRGQVDFEVTNPKVGKVHAEIISQDGTHYIKDMNSKNGTYINGNGQRINSNMPYPLHDNDRITLADSEFTLRCSAR